jgi:hypothetical protein
MYAKAHTASDRAATGIEALHEESRKRNRQPDT